jgi:glycosyltransferase involved in cell wall biosynthesis
MKISIITATWNSGKTLRDTMNSVVSQTYEDIEHIIVDGGSTDETLQIIEEMLPLYHGRIKWISEKDRGIYDAMNKGIKMVSGDVVGILNSDDFYTSNDVLQTVADKIGKNDAVYGDVHYVKENNTTRCVRYYSSSFFAPWMMRCGFMPAHPSFYCKRSVYDDANLYDLSFKVAADFELLLRIIYKEGIQMKYIPKDFVTMRVGGASSSGLKSHKQIIKDHLRAYKKNGIYSNVFFEGFRYVYKLLEVLCYKIIAFGRGK